MTISNLVNKQAVLNSNTEGSSIVEKPDISIIIVNYRVKDYICLLLKSIKRAQGNLSLEIFVIDNNSGDDSVEYLSSRFQDVHFISNKINKGFGKANNQALAASKGKFTLIINPDTIVAEDSLGLMKNYMDENENCGAAGFRLINADGTFARESKRTVPDLKSAIFRVLGLDSAFPKNRILGSRYLGWLPELEVNKVPVISGAAMFWRTALLKELNGFDEDFFMYGEDDDLCFRVKDTRFHISYVPTSPILHFKGESEREESFKHLKKTNEGLLLFFKKHFKKRYSQFTMGLISLAYYVRVLILYISKSFKKSKKREVKIMSSLILISKDENHSLFEMAKQKSISISIVSPAEHLEILAESVIESQAEFKGKAKVVFDINSVSFSKSFELMDVLKDKKMDFHFLNNDEDKIIGKASIIELNL